MWSDPQARPRPPSRDSVQVALRDRRSISRFCRATKRLAPVVGTYSTLSGLLNSATANALQKSTSKPVHLPELSGLEKPILPVETPQRNTPRLLRSLSTSPVVPTAVDASRVEPTSKVSSVDERMG